MYSKASNGLLNEITFLKPDSSRISLTREDENLLSSTTTIILV